MISLSLIVVMAVFIARQLTLGFWDKFQYGELSFILMMPVWWGYLAALPGVYLWVVSAGLTLSQAVLGNQTAESKGGSNDLT